VRRLVQPLLAYVHLFIILALLAVTIPHVALLVERYEQPGFWLVAWAFSVATEVAIAVTAFLLGVTREKQRVLTLCALLFFGCASAAFNAAYFLQNGAPVWLAGTLGAFIPVAVALLAYLGSAISTGVRTSAPKPAQSVQDDERLNAIQDRLDALEANVAQPEPEAAPGGNGHAQPVNDAMELALQAVRGGASVRGSAQRFGIPASTLRSKAKR
jgi:hypothetical protein